jgi:hypothetical protein
LRRQTLDFLQDRFGKSGSWYYNIARGWDERPVRPARWIGVVAFVTVVVLPLACPCGDAKSGWALFEAIEGRFVGAGSRFDSPGRRDRTLWMAWRLGISSLVCQPSVRVHARNDPAAAGKKSSDQCRPPNRQ